MYDWMRNLIGKGDEVADAFKKAEPLRTQRTHGPTKLRTPSNGQIRRAQEREVRSQRRKANLRHRRAWMKHQHLLANLRGVISVAESHTTTSAARRQAVRTLRERYGSVSKARQVLG